jgi:hypothetical protein
MQLLPAGGGFSPEFAVFVATSQASGDGNQG